MLDLPGNPFNRPAWLHRAAHCSSFESGFAGFLNQAIERLPKEGRAGECACNARIFQAFIDL